MTTPVELPVKTLDDRITKALAFAAAYGGFDGAHHKDWVIDQMVRALRASPVLSLSATDAHGIVYNYSNQGASVAYTNFVKDVCAGKDGPNTYRWETGVPP